MSSKESDEDADDPVVSTMPMVINHKMGKKLYYMKDSIIPKYRKPYVTRSARIRPKHHILEFTKSNRERDAPKDPKDKRAYHEMKYQTTEMSRKNTNLAIGYTTGGVFYVSPVAHILRLSPKLEEDTTSKNVMVYFLFLKVFFIIVKCQARKLLSEVVGVLEECRHLLCVSLSLIG